MIYCDDRIGSKELRDIIRRIGAPCELQRLEYGDAAFEGNGPSGVITVGVERKTLSDMLGCIEDSRYAAHQRPGMMSLYSKSFLCIEGLFAPGDGDFAGTLMQGFRRGSSWGALRTRGNRAVPYSKLFRYLVSVSLSGVVVIPSNDIFHTAYNICELQQYFSKKWNQHTSLIEVQKLAIPTLEGKPPLVRRWASDLDDVGVVYSEEAARHFKTGHRLANSSEQDWLGLSGPGGKRLGISAIRKIIRDIRGWM
jgi:ERCC4-type nuclease